MVYQSYSSENFFSKVSEGVKKESNIFQGGGGPTFSGDRGSNANFNRNTYIFQRVGPPS